MNNTIKLSDVEIGKTFKVGGISFIKFAENDGVTVAVSKDIVFKSAYGDNDFSKSTVFERLNKEILPKVAKEIGTENICDFQTDLTTLDGLKPYEVLTSKISIPTFDFYRQNVELFDRYKCDGWWWLATPDTAEPHCNPSWRLCVSPLGNVYGNGCFSSYIGVRPILNFVSSISVSCED